MLGQADQVFDRGSGLSSESAHKAKELHARTGQLTMERNYLKQGLERVHRPCGRKGLIELTCFQHDGSRLLDGCPAGIRQPFWGC